MLHSDPAVINTYSGCTKETSDKKEVGEVIKTAGSPRAHAFEETASVRDGTFAGSRLGVDRVIDKAEEYPLCNIRLSTKSPVGPKSGEARFHTELSDSAAGENIRDGKKKVHEPPVM